MSEHGVTRGSLIMLFVGRFVLWLMSTAAEVDHFCSQRAADDGVPYRTRFLGLRCKLLVGGEWRDWRDVDEWRR